MFAPFDLAVDPPEAQSGFSGAVMCPQDGLSDGGSPSNDLINDVVLDDLDFDFSFDDISLPLSEELESLLSPDRQYHRSDLQAPGDFNFSDLALSSDQLLAVFKSTSSELRHISGDCEIFGGQSGDAGSGVLNSTSPGEESNLISAYLNVQSPESNGSNRDSADGDVKEINCLSPRSQGSKNLAYNVSEGSNDSPSGSVSSALNSSKNSILTGVVDQKVEVIVSDNENGNHSSLKRKKDDEDNQDTNSESWRNKCRKSSPGVEDNDIGNDNSVMSEEEEKRKARLMRNRESAQLSRQRKKHYVEELEDKVRNMQSTIQNLNSKISYFMAENVALKQQMSSGASAVPPPAPMAHPPPAMYPPHPAMIYPWIPYAPPYMVKPQGSQVPLVPIPRLKPQQPTPAPKKVETKKVETKKAESKKVETKKVETKKAETKNAETKKVESKKSEGRQAKKVTSVSILGLLFFTMLFGCLVPLVNVRYGEEKAASLVVGENYLRGGGLSEYHHRRVLMFNETEHDNTYVDSTRSSVHRGQKDHSHGGDELERLRNGSEPLAASLYVPRNDKLVKIDGNLIIHSVLASEKAMASNGKVDSETGLAVPGNLASAVALPGMGMSSGRHSHMRALGSSSVDNDDKKPAANDGALQQWFREGLAGPMLATGMCTEVFQFDVSTAVVPATAKRNITENKNQNSKHLSKGVNRRFLHPFPFPDSSQNVSTEHAGNSSEKDGFHGRTNATSMVVSVLFDPREAGDGDVDGVIGKRTLSRIFVVVLVDSIKYVTYSCVLPFKGSSTTHRVTA